jgi:hypothetical protein
MDGSIYVYVCVFFGDYRSSIQNSKAALKRFLKRRNSNEI